LTPDARSFAWADQIDLSCAFRLMNADATTAGPNCGYLRAVWLPAATVRDGGECYRALVANDA
jgi:hypothetical protein